MPDWRYVDEHSFIGMAVTVATADGREVDGEIAAIWEFEGEPRRVDVDTGDGLLNTDRDRLEVVG